MSKGARKTGRARRKRPPDLPIRRRQTRPIKTKVLIVGQGRKTEPNYFRGLKREDAVTRKFAVSVKKGRGLSPEAAVEQAITLQQQAQNREETYDKVWCVLDVEGPANRASLGRAAKAAAENEIALCRSNPCFEVWLLAHFERRARAYSDCDAVIVQLNTHWRRHCGQDYEKNDERVYDRVSELTATAIANAQSVRETHHRGKTDVADCNSATEVYLLLQKLIG
jgi:hypothetical protein